MSSQTPFRDTDAFLALLDARISALQELRASYLAAKATGALGRPEEVAAAIGAPARAATPTAELAPVLASPLVEVSAPVTAPVEFSPAPSTTVDSPAAPEAGRRRRHLGIAAAVRTYLQTMDGARRAAEIARDLKQRGIAAPKLDQTVTSLLHRLRQRGEVERVTDGWIRVTPGMEIPNRMPARLRAPRSAPAGPTPDRREGGLAWKIESLLKSHGQPVAARYVAEATGEPLNVVGLTLGRMVRQQRVEKQSDGRFAVVMSIADPAAAVADDAPHQNGHDAT